MRGGWIFILALTGFVAEPAPAPAMAAKASARSPCLMQNGSALIATPIRAVGTEPFWGARIEGRCVTYSELDDQKGLRIWARFTRTPTGGVWTGAYRGKPFVLRTRADPGCSDGMSDRVYPTAVDLRVGGERRKGCAFNP